MSLLITEVNVTPIRPQAGLVAFASVVLEKSIYLSSIAIYTRPDGSYRLLYPTKKLGGQTMNLFHPISREASKKIEAAVFKKCNEIFKNHDQTQLY